MMDACGSDGGGAAPAPGFSCDQVYGRGDPLGFSPSTSLEAAGSAVGLKQMSNIYVVHKSNLILSLRL